MFNAIRQHAVSWPLAIGEEPSDGEQKRHRGGRGMGVGLRISSDRDDRRIFLIQAGIFGVFKTNVLPVLFFV